MLIAVVLPPVQSQLYVAAAGDDCSAAHRMVVLVHVGRAGAIGTEQGWSIAADDGQSFNRLALHHADFCQVAVVAAQAEEDDGVGVMGAGDRALSREGDRVGGGPSPLKVKDWP